MMLHPDKQQRAVDAVLIGVSVACTIFVLIGFGIGVVTVVRWLW